MLTLRKFLDAAYAVLVEEGLRVGVPLDGVLDSVAEWAAGVRAPAGGSNDDVPIGEKSEADIVAQNNAALAAIEAMGF